MEIKNYDRYPGYKDSGEKWLEEIPKHWELSKLGSILKPVSIKNKAQLPLLSITRERGVIKRDISDLESNHNFIPDDLSGYKMIEKGQFGMNKMKAWQGSYGVSKYTGIVSPAYYIFNFMKEIHPDFFNIAIRSKFYVPYFGQASDGVRIGQWDLSKSRMKEIPFVIPPLQEQEAIAKFLDEKCGKIDKAIEQKKKLIQLLKERKQIIIQDAITKGIDPDVPMKDSGVEWIGEIPEHWEVKKVKHIFKLIVEPAEKNNNHELLSIYTDIGVRPRKELKEKGNRASTTDGYWIVKKGDFIVNKLLAWMGAIGLSEYEGVTSPAYDILRSYVEINHNYFHELFRMPLFSQEMKKHSRGIMEMRLRLYFDKFGDILVPFPSKEEQDKIMKLIGAESDKLNKAISLQNQQIQRLREYKEVLINDAVTGKIRVK